MGGIEIQLTVLATNRAKQIIVAADNDALRSRFGGDDVERLTGDAQPAPLANGEMMDAGMLAKNMTGLVADLAASFGGGNSLLPEIGVDEGRIIAIGDKADLLAVGPPLPENRARAPARGLEAWWNSPKGKRVRANCCCSRPNRK